MDEDIVDALISAGLRSIFVGLEASTQKVLDRLDKKTTRKSIEKNLTWLLSKKIDIEISFINFLPFNTIEDIKENITFFSEWGIDTLRSIGNRLEPYPGTPLYYELHRKDNLRRDVFFYEYKANTDDPKTDILYAIIEPSIPLLALLSHQLRLTKALLWKKKSFVKDFENLHNSIAQLQRIVVIEARDIFLILINEVSKNQVVDISVLTSEVYQLLNSWTEKWLSYFLEMKQLIRNQVSNK